MSVRPEMHSAEKFAWVAVLVSFTILEVLAINRSDKKVETAREEENKQFQSIAKGITDGYASNQSQFKVTMDEAEKVFGKTKEAADLAKEGINEMMGAGSFLIIFPHGTLSKVEQDEGIFRLYATVRGKHVVWDAEVAMREGPLDEKWYAGPHELFQLRPIAPTHLAVVGGSIHPSKTGTTTYGIQIEARGVWELENLQVRFNPERQKWEFQYWVYKETAGSTPRPPILIKHIDWTSIYFPVFMPQ